MMIKTWDFYCWKTTSIIKVSHMLSKKQNHLTLLFILFCTMFAFTPDIRHSVDIIILKAQSPYFELFLDNHRIYIESFIHEDIFTSLIILWWKYYFINLLISNYYLKSIAGFHWYSWFIVCFIFAWLFILFTLKMN